MPRIPTFEDHLEYANPPIRPVLIYLRGRINTLGRMPGAPPMGEGVTEKQRIKYEVRGGRDFCEVKVAKNYIQVRVFDKNVPDPKRIATDIPKSHDWPWEKNIKINSNVLVDYAIPFIEASYLSPRAKEPRR